MNSIRDHLGIHANALTLREKRNDLLASNIANAATPNYKARDIDFAAELQKASATGPMQTSNADSIDDMYLTFAVAGEDYGVVISVVTEIVGMQRIMGIPDVPPYIKGVINLRGKVIPLMDVRLRFGMPDKEYDERTVVIVLDVGDAPMGLIVDRVSEVVEIPSDRIDRKGFNNADGRSVVAGLGRIDERVAIILDEALLVSDVEFELPKGLNKN